MPKITEKALKQKLAKRGLESVSIKRELPDGRIEVEANKLHPIPVEGHEPVYVPIPVSLSLGLDARGRIQSIDGDIPSLAAVADASRYVATVRDTGQLASAGQQTPVAGLTHQIERDKQGRQILRRKRFSIS